MQAVYVILTSILSGFNCCLFVISDLRAGRNCSLETGSPGSDSASTGSDSPSLNALAGFSRSIPGPQVQRSQNTSTVSSLSVMVNGGINGNQTPPPVPPRLPMPGVMGNIHGQSPILENSFNSNHSVMSSPGQTQSTPVKSHPMRKQMPAMSPALSPLQPMCGRLQSNHKVTISYKSKQPNNQPPPPYTLSPGKQSVVIQGPPGHLQQPNGSYIMVSSAERQRQDVRIQVNQQGKGHPVAAQSKNSQTIITQVVESTSVSRPQLQTATGPAFQQQEKPGHHGSYVSSVQKMVNGPTQQPKRAGQVQISVKSDQHPGTEQVIFPRDNRHLDHNAFTTGNPNHLIIKFSNQSHPYGQTPNEYGYPVISETLSTSRSGSPMSTTTSGRNQSPMSFSSSGTSDIPDHPPPPYPGPSRSQKIAIVGQAQQPKPHTPLSLAYPVPKTQTVRSVPAGIQRGVATPPEQPPLPPRVPIMKNPPPPPPTGKDESQPPIPPKDFLLPKQQNRPSPGGQGQNSEQNDNGDTDLETVSNASDVSATENKRTCTSPIPERLPDTEENEILRRDSSVRNYSPAAYKFFMEQHVENLIKNYTQRQTRKFQLEKEMAKANLSADAQEQMRRMLQQKESNYIRMKRSKMKKDMFEKITKLGVGAFGEVHLVQKKDVMQLYAMKTLRKMDVYKRNQVAHVKAERDILAEADNEWVVKLYYSFQDRDNLYFVMDYIPGGDLMGLLIRKEIFDQSLARFYIAELVLAIESVHRMGFIHRDIKPDNILIDKFGHIKLTDFGLCTGFRWTHNSKYYQKGRLSPLSSFPYSSTIDTVCFTFLFVYKTILFMLQYMHYSLITTIFSL